MLESVFHPAIDVMTRPRPIHRYQGGSSTRNERLGLLVFVAVLLFLLLILFAFPRQAAWVGTSFELLQPVGLVLILLAAAIGSWQFARRQRAAEEAMQAAAADDAFWSPQALHEQVSELFELYWHAVAERDAERIAERLTPYWYGVLTEGFADWRADETRPVMFALELRKITVVGLEDWKNNQRDQVSVRIDAYTAYHATHIRSGELVEGLPTEREEEQLWQLVRGERGWLINRVDMVADAGAYKRCRILREAA